MKTVFSIRAIRKKLKENGNTLEYQIIDDNNEVLTFDSYEEAVEKIKSELEADPDFLYSVEKYYTTMEEK